LRESAKIIKMPPAAATGNSGMEQLIPIVNKLQDAFTQLGVTMQLGKDLLMFS